MTRLESWSEDSSDLCLAQSLQAEEAEAILYREMAEFLWILENKDTECLFEAPQKV